MIGSVDKKIKRISEKGITLLEGLVSTAIIGIGFVAVFQMVQYSVRSIDVSGERTKATYIVGTIAEDIYAFKNQEKGTAKYVELLKDKVDIIGVIVMLDRQEGYSCSVSVKSVISKTEIMQYKLKELVKKKKSTLCFSADLDDKNKLIEILSNIGDKIVICKIHYDIYEDILVESKLVIKMIKLIKQNSELLNDNKVLKNTLNIRNAYLDPLSLIQVSLMKKMRKKELSQFENNALLLSINGLAAGLRNTG